MQGGFFLLLSKQWTGRAGIIMADYAYTLKTLIDEVIDEAKDSSLSRPRVARYIRQTHDSVLGHHRFKFNEDVLAETLSAASTDYEYDCDHQQIIQVVLSHISLTAPAEPTYLTPDEFFERYPTPATLTQGMPLHYTDYGNKLYWSCPLNLNYTHGMRYQRAPRRLVDEKDTPEIPVEFGDILFEGGMAGVERYRENHDIAAIHDRRVEARSEDFLGRYGLRKRGLGKARTSRTHRA